MDCRLVNEDRRLYWNARTRLNLRQHCVKYCRTWQMARAWMTNWLQARTPAAKGERHAQPCINTTNDDNSLLKVGPYDKSSLPKHVDGCHTQNVTSTQDREQSRHIGAAIGGCQQNPCAIQKCDENVQKCKEAKHHEGHLIACTHGGAYKSAEVIKPIDAAVAAWLGAVFGAKRASNFTSFTLLPITRCAVIMHFWNHYAGISKSGSYVE